MKVSVVIPIFNDAGTIAETLESVFAQRFDGAVRGDRRQRWID